MKAISISNRTVNLPTGNDSAMLKNFKAERVFIPKSMTAKKGDKITILLPDPKVVMTSSKINRDEVKEYVGLTRSYFTDKELSSYEQQGRQSILNSVSQLGIKQTAQENAARVLVPMLTEMGYKEENITIAFRKSLDIMKLINSNLEQK